MQSSNLELHQFTFVFPAILLGLLAALILSPAVLRLSRRVGLLDVPGSSTHKMHQAATPMGGGIVIGSALLVSALWFQWFKSAQILGILLAAAIVLAFGLWDDLRGLGALRKLIGQVLAALVLVLTGTQVLLFANDALNVILTFIWVIGVINAFNFVDSMDGMALGLGAIAAAFFMLVTVKSSQPELSALSAAILGTSIGFYLFNVMPARMFLGDSGSQLLGLVLASVAVAYNPVGLERLSSWFVPILVLGIPIFYTMLVVVSRLRARRPIYKAALDHTYHRLIQMRFEPSQAVAAMHIAAVALGIIAFLALGSVVLIATLIFATVLLGGLGIILFFEVRAVSD